MESKCFYFSGHEEAEYFTHKFEVRKDGMISFEEIGDERTISTLYLSGKEKEAFIEFLKSL